MANDLQSPPAAATRRCGAIGNADSTTTFRVWAPRTKRVDLVLIDGQRRRTLPMTKEPGGYFGHTEADVSDGQQYAFSLDGGGDRQDPYSMYQPAGVGGPSAVVRPERFAWTDNYWRGIGRAELVVYELHVGTFTAEGTFEAAIPRLQALCDLGITAIEVMPIAQFPGSRNWGYDGVLPYAAQDSYGGPQGFQKLVDAAHAVGLAVILDVVYNHMGPEGNYLNEFGPYFTDKYKTPWGAAINYDDRESDAVRDYVLDNVRMWLKDFHLDGLRLDAVHAIYDLGALHILREVKLTADDVATRTGRSIHIIAESDLNDPRIVNPPDRGGHGLDAQWSDDFHHAVHAFLTGERRGYYCEFGEPAQLAKVLNTPFICAGDYSHHRGRRHGAPPEGLSGDRFVVCIQNHDQVGNRARGDRLSEQLGSFPKLRLAASLLLLSPHLPMLFMGEEYGEENPFPFFCSFHGEELIEAVRKGRKREFADFLTEGETIPDPHGQATFESAKLSWSWPDGSPRAGLRTLYADLLAARKHWPALRDFDRRAARLVNDGKVLELIRGGTSAEASDTLIAYFNLTDKLQTLSEPVGDRVVHFSSEGTRYGGERREEVKTLYPFEAVAFGPAGWKRLG